MNNNNNNVSGMVNDTILIASLKSVVRDIVREELMFQGIPVNDPPKPQFTANHYYYDPEKNMMQNIMPNSTSVNDVCIDYRRRNLKHCNTCFVGNNCLARFETKTFDVDEFNRRYNGAILEGMTIRQFFNLPEVRKFKGSRTDADIASVIFFKLSNTFVGVKDIKDDVVLMDLRISHVCNRTFPDNKIVIYVNVTGLTKDEDDNVMANTCPMKKEESKSKTYKDLKDFGLFDLMPNGFNLYLDDEEIVGSDDSMEAQFNYDIDTGVYSLNNNSNTKVTYDELQDCEVTCIGADADFVPTLWIKPSEEWYKKFEYSKLAAALSNVKDNKSDAMDEFFANEEKGLMAAIAANAKPKRQYKRRRSVNK